MILLPVVVIGVVVVAGVVTGVVVVSPINDNNISSSSQLFAPVAFCIFIVFSMYRISGEFTRIHKYISFFGNK